VKDKFDSDVEILGGPPPQKTINQKVMDVTEAKTEDGGSI